VRTPRRVGLLVAFLAAAFLGGPGSGRAERIAMDRDFSTVGRIVTRVVEGRTVVVIPVAGPARVRLSEPFRISNHWRLYLTIEDARLSFRGSDRKRPEGLMGLEVAEIGNDVRLRIDVRSLGDYAARPSEEGYLVWIDSEPRPVLPAASPLLAPSAPVATSSEPVPPRAPGRSPWAGGLFLGLLAAVAGLAVRHVRRHGLPSGVADFAAGAVPGIRKVLFGSPRATTSGSRGNAERPKLDMERVPRGRSADIGDAFRVEPETPPSGIAALATTQGTDDT
jgi:hypothetical protein